MMGDFGQLPPVLDLPVYSRDSRDSLSNDGLAAYMVFNEVCRLGVVQRQSGSSLEQQEFRNLLLRLRDGESTIEDWKTLSERFEENITRSDRDRFKNAVFLSTRWDEVNVINVEQLKSLNVPVARITAVQWGY